MSKILSLFSLLFLVSSAHASIANCTAAAGEEVGRYLNDRMFSRPGDPKYRHQLYKSFTGRNGYNQIVYTFMYQATNGKNSGIVRLTTDQKCKMTTAGMYRSEEDMEADDREAAQEGP